MLATTNVTSSAPALSHGSRSTYLLLKDHITQLSVLFSVCKQRMFKRHLRDCEDGYQFRSPTSTLLAIGNGMPLSSVRSLAPAFITALEDLASSYTSFWSNGGQDTKAKDLSSTPTIFLSHDRSLTLHYGIDPLLELHLATAYASLQSASPLQSKSSP